MFLKIKSKKKDCNFLLKYFPCCGSQRASKRKRKKEEEKGEKKSFIIHKKEIKLQETVLSVII